MPEPASIPPSGSAPFHPLSSTLLLVVDNLWNLADWAAAAWVFTIPLSFLSVAAPVAMIQRRLHGDSWGRALLKGFFLGILAGVPTSITGTPVGIALLAWAGIDRMNRGNAALPASLASPPLPPNPNEGALPPPTEPTTVAPPLTPPPRVSQAHWVWLAIVVVLCASGLVATKLVLDRAGKLAGTIFENTSRIAEKFSQGKITETFTAALPVLTHQPGGNLELATATATETFTRTDERSIAWDMIPLGKTV
ncbi:MAG: hypothetical protein HY300_15375, partial [Verrucomicrobia bacterium]|nr:hypothetical protein [Verrucomicrobiota bacterium]